MMVCPLCEEVVLMLAKEPEFMDSAMRWHVRQEHGDWFEWEDGALVTDAVPAAVRSNAALRGPHPVRTYYYKELV